jgi:hypothetical protein
MDKWTMVNSQLLMGSSESVVSEGHNEPWIMRRLINNWQLAIAH